MAIETFGKTLNMSMLKFLSNCLYSVKGKKVIILIDEYDVPLENAYFSGFYDETVAFLRSLFESALKTNPCLEFAVLTGCLRISKESIFTGLNNLKTISILTDIYGEYFGFLPGEVDEMLAFYERREAANTVKEWYDGYRFGNAHVYNPWSVICYMDNLYANPKALPSPYWSNTSSNSIVKDLVLRANAATRDEMERLIAGKSIEKPVHEDITYADVNESMDNLGIFYHGFLLVILANMADYLVRSNREGGNGRYDILVCSYDVEETPILIELKVSDTFQGMDAACERALAQIEEKGYDAELPDEGYTCVYHFGIAFFKKQCRVKVRRKEFY